MKTLVFSPHIDDEVLGCGGAIYNRTQRGNSVTVCFLGVEVFHEVPKADRILEAQSAATCLGYKFEIMDNPVNSYDKKHLIGQLTNFINEYKPDEVFVPLATYNQDHQEVHAAAIIALRPHDRNYFVRDIMIYEVDQYQLWSPTVFHPTYFEKIDIEKKIEAYHCHRSQVRPTRPPDLLRNFAAIRGLSSGYDYAEGFLIHRMVR